ncbi:MAG: sugar ABC transporter substrate-binding protein [Sphaerochaeta sp.]|jgi:ABC-type sugar transport system substrate-binding protein
MKKKVLVGLLLVLMLVSVSQVFAQGKTEKVDTTGLVGSGKTIAFVPKQLGNPYFVAVKDAVEEASLANGFRFRSNAPDSSIEVDKQISIVEAFIAQGVDYLVLIPNDATAIVDVINDAAKQKIPVFLVDSGADESDYVAYIGTDNYAGGVLAAEWFGANLTGQVAIIDGAAGNAATTARFKGFMDTIKNYPHLEVVTSDYGNGDMGTSMTVAENFLTAYPNLSAIFACDDQMAQGAGQAVMARNKADSVFVCGFDGSPDGAQAIIDGVMDASVAQQPRLMGKTAVDYIIKLINGETIEPIIYTDCEMVLASNAPSFLEWH